MEKTRQMIQDKLLFIMHQIGCFVRDVILETGSREEVCRVVAIFIGKIYFYDEIQHRFDILLTVYHYVSQ
jgi:hypothetical protein